MKIACFPRHWDGTLFTRSLAGEAARCWSRARALDFVKPGMEPIYGRERA